MNKPIQAYHFTKPIFRDFISFFKKIENYNGIVCFDFEDSISSMDNIETMSLKNSIRRTIINELLLIDGKIDFKKIGLRVNESSTSYYQDDIEGIRALHSINSIFLPKTENHILFGHSLAEIPKGVNEIIPIIESKKGFENLEQILSIDDPRFNKIAFGHCDFNLSYGNFPFFHQDSNVYWDFIKYLDNLCKLKRKQLINSPVLKLKDRLFFSQVVKMNRTYPTISGQITLSLDQAYLCSYPLDCSPLNLKTNILSPSDKIAVAKKTYKSFENHKVKNRFFALDSSRMLISPQEFRSASALLKPTSS